MSSNCVTMQSSKFIKEVKQQLEKSSDVNSFISDGENILHKTVKGCGRLDVVEYLLGRGSDVHSTTDYGANVIHLALESMKKKNFASTKRLIKYFIDKKVKVNARDGAGDSVFHYLIKNCKNTNQVISLTDLLLQSNAQINTSNNLGQTALHLAVELVNHALSEYLISAGANVDSRTKQFKSALQISIEKNNVLIAKLLIEKNASLKQSVHGQDSLLHTAIKCTKAGKLRNDLVKVLLAGGAETDVRDSTLSTPLHLALKNKDEDCAKLLIDQGCIVNCKDKSDESPLRIAVWKKLRKSVKLLLLKGANPNDVRITVYRDCGVVLRDSLMQDAIVGGDIPIIQLLVEFGTNMGKIEVSHYLFLAAKGNHVPLAKYFLSKGADVNYEFHRENALFWTLEIKSNVPENLVQLLIDHGANVIRGAPLHRPLYHRRCERNALCLIRHLALLTVENYDIGEENLAELASKPRYEKYYSLCLVELRLMRSNPIPFSNLSLYDVLLKKDDDELAKCVQNESIVNLIKSNETLSKYPKYSWNLRYRLAQGQERLSLISKGRRFFTSAIPLVIPLEILNLICEQLSNEDLTNLSEIYSTIQKVPEKFTMSLRDGTKKVYFTHKEVYYF